MQCAKQEYRADIPLETTSRPESSEQSQTEIQ